MNRILTEHLIDARSGQLCSTPRSAEFIPSPLLLDTRPIFARGETPCQAIDDAVASLIPEQALVLLVSFEPVPLYTKLGNQGFTYQSSQQADGSWRVEFRKKS